MPHPTLNESDFIQARLLIEIILTEGYSVSVYDGETYQVRHCTKRYKLLSAMGSTGSDTLYVHDHLGSAKGGFIKVGTIVTVYGNEPGVMIHDHSCEDEIHCIMDEFNRGLEAIYDM